MATPPNPEDPADALRSALDRALARPSRDPLSALAEVVGRGTAPPSAQLSGLELGGWRLVRLLGMGGMGATYEARSATGDVVAVKVVGVLNAQQEQRFRAECATLSSLDHPAIVRYRDHGFGPNGEGFLVMDLVPGQSLEDLLEECANEPCSAPARAMAADIAGRGGVRFRDPSWQRRVLRLGLTLAEALAAAHQRGIVHRDLKPANVLIGEDLRPTLIDFGLSRDLFRHQSLTRSGAVLGTLTYMAPEQLDGHAERVTAATDVYAMGLLLFRLLTGQDLRQEGREVFAAERREVVLGPAARHLAAPVRAILYRCLQRRPARRYATAAELAADLSAVLGTGRVAARHPGQVRLWFRGPLRGVAWGAVGLALGLLLGAWMWLGRTAEVWFRAVNCFGSDLRIDGAQYAVPGTVRLSFGDHLVEYSASGDALSIRRVLTVDRSPLCVSLLTVGVNSNRTKLTPDRTLGDPGQRPAFLRVRLGAPTDQLFVDDQAVLPGDRWMRVAPGPHKVEARAADGALVELQTVDLAAHELSEVALGDSRLRALPGRFRRTLACALGPFPPDVRLDCGPGAAAMLNNDKEDSGFDGRSTPYVMGKVVVTPLVTGRPVEATLSVEFPETMGSVAFAFRCSGWKPAKVEVHYRLDDGEWLKGPELISNGDSWSLPKDVVRVVVPSQGARSLSLRATMQVTSLPDAWATLDFLEGQIDNPRETAPCFGVVADPVGR